MGTIAGFCTIIGMGILIYRRRTVGPVFSATTKMDKAMYAVLGTVIVLGLANIVIANIFGHYDYRDGVSIWFRGIFWFSPHPELMAQAPIGFKLHASPRSTPPTNGSRCSWKVSSPPRRCPTSRRSGASPPFSTGISTGLGCYYARQGKPTATRCST
jgi:hypothetical protein